MDKIRIDDFKVSTSNESTLKQDRWVWQFLAVVLAALALRFYQLGAESLWIDEGYSIRDANLAEHISRASKPLYYWVLSGWMHFGDADWFLRIPAVIFGVGAVAVVFLLGRKLWNTRIGFFASILAAVSPMQIGHSQEIRMYTLLMFTSAASVYLLIVGLERRQMRYMAVAGACTLCAMLTHPLACLLLIPDALLVIDRNRRSGDPVFRYLMVLALVGLAWLPWLPQVLGFGTGFAGSWAAVEQKPSLSEIPLLWTQFGVGDWDYASAGAESRLLLMLYTLGIIGAMTTVVWCERRKPETRFVAAWLLFPVATLFLLSVIKTNAWMTRYLIFTSPAFYLLLGAFWARQKKAVTFMLLGAFLFLLPSAKLVRFYQKTMRPEWKPAVRYVMDHQKPDDVIGVYRSGNKYVFRHYYKGRASWLALGPRNFSKDELVGWDEKKAVDLLRSMPPAPRKWLYVAMMPAEAEAVIEQALYKHYRVLQFRKYNGIKLYLFQGN